MTRPTGYNTLLKEYLEELRSRELSWGYIRKNELYLKKIFQWLKKGNRTIYPTKATYDDVIHIRDKVPVSNQPNRSTRYQRNHVDIFRGFLKFCGNHIKQPPFQRYNPHRPRTSARDYDTIMLELEDREEWDMITGKMIVLLGSLGIRRVGQLRLRPDDVQEDRLYVLGKGKYGGKPRVLPIDPWIYSELRNYLDMRREIIKECLEKRPDQEIPKKLYIWYNKHGRMGSVHQTKYDTILLEVSKITGIKVTTHMLRRYGGTEIYQVTKDKEVSMRFGGWGDANTWRDYLGIDQDLADAVEKMMRNRLERINRFQTDPKVQKKCNLVFEPDSAEGGV